MVRACVACMRAIAGSEVERVVDMAGTRFSGEDMRICAEMQRDEAVRLDYVPNGEGSILIRRDHF